MTKYILSFTHQCLKLINQHKPDHFGQGFCLQHLPRGCFQCCQFLQANAGLMRAGRVSLHTGITPLCLQINFNFFRVVDGHQFSKGNSDSWILHLNYTAWFLSSHSEALLGALSKSPGVCGTWCESHHPEGCSRRKDCQPMLGLRR